MANTAKLLAMQAMPGATMLSTGAGLAVAVSRNTVQSMGGANIGFETGSGQASVEVPAAFSAWCTADSTCSSQVGSALQVHKCTCTS